MLWHYVFQVIAVYVAWRHYQSIAQQNPLPVNETKQQILMACAILGAFLGSRGLNILQEPQSLSNTYHISMYVLGSKTIVGTLLGGLIAIEATKKCLGITHSTGNRMVYPLIVGILIGRIGCLLYGVADHTVGVASTLPWAINFGDGVLRHPTSAYEMLMLACCFVFLKYLDRNITMPDGVSFKLFLAIYLTYRLMIAFIQPSYLWLGMLSAIQWACLLGLLYYATYALKQAIATSDSS
jgi:phosphatidylglycerol---prolipoprotein diacylglyceryl transferase